MIFDHWWNFGRFDEGYDERDGSKIKSSKEKTFIKRIEILEYCIKHSLNDDMLLMDKLIQSDLRMLPDDAMPVKEKWRELAELRKLGDLPADSPEYDHLIKYLFYTKFLISCNGS